MGEQRDLWPALEGAPARAEKGKPSRALGRGREREQLRLWPETVRALVRAFVRWDPARRRWRTRLELRSAVVLRRWSDRLLVRFVGPGGTLSLVRRHQLVPDGPCRAALLRLTGMGNLCERDERR